LLNFLPSGDSDIASIVINESKEEGAEACKFLEDVRVAFPQVCNFFMFVYRYFYLFTNFQLNHTWLYVLKLLDHFLLDKWPSRISRPWIVYHPGVLSSTTLIS